MVKHRCRGLSFAASCFCALFTEGRPSLRREMRDGALSLRCCRRLLNVPSGGRSLFFAHHRGYSGKLVPPNRAPHRTSLRGPVKCFVVAPALDESERGLSCATGTRWPPLSKRLHPLPPG